ncbi:MAG: GMC family oxidoreductase, partial [Myxococcota bacterium]
HDHPNVQLFFQGRRDVDCNYPQLYGFHRVGNDPSLAPNQADSCFVFYPARSSFREGLMRLLPGIALPERLYNMRIGPALVRGGVQTLFRQPSVQDFVKRLWGIVVILGKPRSRGRLWLESADPRVPASIDPGYFADPEDLRTLLNGVTLARDVANCDPLRGFGSKELLPGPLNRNLKRWARKNVMTTYHYAGTCALGEVVDLDLCVRGIEGLRVADASVMPITPVAALNAPSMMIALRAAQRMS